MSHDKKEKKEIHCITLTVLLCRKTDILSIENNIGFFQKVIRIFSLY